jgi:hypothetical protein
MLKRVGLIVIRFYALHPHVCPVDSLASFTLFITQNRKHSQIENLDGIKMRKLKNYNITCKFSISLN